MKRFLNFTVVYFFISTFGQSADIPDLIPKSINKKTGYIDQKGNVIIEPQYHIAMFFAEDCNLLNSPKENLRQFGSADFATVEQDRISYRIDKTGKRVYQYQKNDLGKCLKPYETLKYKAFAYNGFYGLTIKSDADVRNFRDFEIYPQYQMLYVLDGNIEDPMIIAVRENKFGIINKKNQVVIPFEYEDIKTNLSWKTANLFEVSKDGNEYFYINKNNHAY